jgi:hypothetical protein
MCGIAGYVGPVPSNRLRQLEVMARAVAHRGPDDAGHWHDGAAAFAESAEFCECGPVPYALVSGLRYALWQLIRLVIKAYLLVEMASDKGGIYTADMMFRLTKPGEEKG